MIKTEEQAFVEQLVAHAAVKTLDISILGDVFGVQQGAARTQGLGKSPNASDPEYLERVREHTHTRKSKMDSRPRPHSKSRNKTAGKRSAVPKSLRDNTSQALLDIASNSQTGVKLIADAPLEWLPVGDLPLGIALDASRIPSTPGILMMTQLARGETLYLDPKAFTEVLVVSSFLSGDSIRNDVRIAMETMAGNSKDHLRVRRISL